MGEAVNNAHPSHDVAPSAPLLWQFLEITTEPWEYAEVPFKASRMGTVL